ncbi:hypothetical protein WUBG_15646 [Wuchereria bancrofti]|uniref:Uncharacterized protein n=1 Tax=Wuchereria bancrofti TaxID=6293 RepID=J9E8Y3_WUCBA|nr:hypothetical protein WUBG_15646 [Wuchereria bancrofti]
MNSYGNSPLAISHHVNLPMPSSLIKNFTTNTYTSKEPKRVALEIQYEISSLPEQSKPIRTRGGQVTNVKTYYPRTVSSLSLSSAFGKRQQILKNDDLSQTLHSKKITNNVQKPPSTGIIKKDLYAMEQDMVGPPGQQRPNNLIRKQFSSSSLASTISSTQSSLMRMSSRSVSSPVLSVQQQGRKLFENNVSTVIKLCEIFD